MTSLFNFDKMFSPISCLSFDYRSFTSGFVGGCIGVGISHPPDTVRVVYQESNGYTSIVDCARDLYRQGGVSRFYRGILPPLVGVGLEKCVLFGFYDNIKRNVTFSDNYHINGILSGMMAGLMCTSVVTPVERVKIMRQNSHDITISTLMRAGFRNMYRGWSATLFREVPGYGIYFYVYEYLKSMYGMSWYSPMLYGAASGAISWIPIYPSDPVKTRMQNTGVSLVEATTAIFRTHGLFGFYRGMSLALLRAIPLHGGVFTGYELCRHFIHEC
jgi:hypothetical protein